MIGAFCHEGHELTNVYGNKFNNIYQYTRRLSDIAAAEYVLAFNLLRAFTVSHFRNMLFSWHQLCMDQECQMKI